MESEKVKEIKDSIQRKINRSEKGEDDFVNCVSVDMLKMYLTLINELENENEMLMKLQARGGCRVAELGIENQQLKDRIAELENTDYYKEIEKKKEELLCKEYGLIKYEKETAGKYLKQFAEKLKETAFRMSPNSNEKFIYAQNVDVILDKLLKEYREWRISD